MQSISVRFTSQEVDALEEVCRLRRKKTGESLSRHALLREAARAICQAAGVPWGPETQA